jgi:hypothetical protein
MKVPVVQSSGPSFGGVPKRPLCLNFRHTHLLQGECQHSTLGELGGFGWRCPIGDAIRVVAFPKHEMDRDEDG